MAKPPLGSKLDLAHPLSQGVSAFYLHNEMTGNTCYDLSRNGHTATATTGLWGSDVNGPAININATASHVFATAATISTPAVPLTCAVSLVGWVVISGGVGVKHLPSLPAT